MIKDFKRGEVVSIVERSIDFSYIDDPNAGFTFPCDENGVLLDSLSDAAKENYKWCMEHPERFGTFNKIIVRRRHYKEPNTGICICGEKIEFYDEYMGACQCPRCGRWYNLFGQELVSPQYWEEDE